MSLNKKYRILIVSPSFPPVNTPDMHRVRLTIPLLHEQGFDYDVIAVKPEYIEASTDPVLEKYVSYRNIHYVKAFSPGLTRKFGLGNLGYRSMWQIKKKGDELLKRGNYDLVYFSTTAFPVMILGRIWKRRFHLPFVLDMQDPWRNDFYLTKPKSERPPKYFLAHRMNSYFEKRTMKKVDGLISVSEAYPEMLNSRYGLDIPSSVIPFSTSESDFQLIRRISLENNIFTKKENRLDFIYTGAITPGMRGTLEFLMKIIKRCSALLEGMEIRLIFVGTTYGKGVSDKYTVMPIASKLGMSDMVTEIPERVGYFEAIKALTDADLIIFPGSVDSGYTASKIFPYILSHRPVFAISHERSSVHSIIKGCNAGKVITFSDFDDLLSKEEEVKNQLIAYLQQLPAETKIDYNYFEKYSESVMVKRQVEFFRKIISDYEGRN